MTTMEYQYLCDFLMRSSGLALGPDKEYLIRSRLEPLAQSWGLAGIPDLVSALKKGVARLGAAVTDAMTTNETSFFRDKQPFEDFKTVLQEKIIRDRRAVQRLRIWCAASSSGQEPYSIAMLLKDSFPELTGWKVEIIATDIATKMLDRAASGIYSQFEVQRGLPIQMLVKHFQQIPEGWQIKPDIRGRITWKKLNLLDDFSALGAFDVVFCRNVLIYFENDAKRQILNRIRRQLRDDGFLLLGSAETVLGICDAFQRATGPKSSMYQPASSAAISQPNMAKAAAVTVCSQPPA